jgi:GNAT superfamily N-acetyltransferase
VGLPADQSEWRDLVRAGMPPCWSLIADGSGGSVWRRDSVSAVIVPKAPDRSIFNSVFYDDPEHLLSSLDAIASSYERAGVNAWTVWVPMGDPEVCEALEAAGHAFDGEPRYMGMALSDLVEPEGEPDFAISEREDYAEIARINEIAYGYPPGDFDAVAESPMPGGRFYFAELEGEPVTTLGVWPNGSDVVAIWVATLPEARGRGIAGRLLAHALANAREQGYETTTLQASKLGRAIYERLGYRDCGHAALWERRRD